MTSCFLKRALMLRIPLKDSNMFRLGFTSVTFRKLSREEICVTAKENGIEYIEWGGDVHLPPDDENALEEIIGLQKKYGIKAISYGSYYRVGQKDYVLFDKILSVSEKIGCKRIRLWLGILPSDKTDKNHFDSLVEETRALCDKAMERDVILSFEFHEGTFNDNGISSLEFLKAVSRENLSTYWQPLRVKNDFENLKTVAPYVNGVHVFQWDCFGMKYALDEGTQEWNKYIAYLRDNSLNTDYILEFVKDDSPEQFKNDARILKEILASVYN